MLFAGSGSSDGEPTLFEASFTVPAGPTGYRFIFISHSRLDVSYGTLSELSVG
ncbi:hypothetical protein QE435_000417 [Rhizobium sp. SORGH_AS 787]|nr:hypothetical protein [Rhizobium sp. SORGH_AS_0787]